MALSPHNTLLREREEILDEQKNHQHIALGATAVQLDEAIRTSRLAMEDNPYFGHDGISGHGYPMIARDDMTGLRRR